MSTQDAESALLSFDETHPCWTRAMFALSGMETGIVDRLVDEGFLECEEGCYFLSEKGAARFVRAAANCFLPLKPGRPGPNKGRIAARSELWMLLDKRHLQRWGLKEYVAPFTFEVPDLADDELFVAEGKRVEWRCHRAPAFERMARDFPAGLAARRVPAPASSQVSAWLESHAPRRRTMTVDLLYKSRYDFQAYAAEPPLPADPCTFLNTDRFLFVFGPAPAEENRGAFLRTVAEFQMFLTMLRHLYLPGFTDLDSMDQDSINWLLFAFRDERDARACAELLAPLPEAPGGGTAPSEVWSVSFEALRANGEALENIWDLLPFAAHPIRRVAS